MGEKNRHFTAEFKRNAVQLVTEKGMPVGKAARELDIHPNQLHLWRRQFLKEGDKAFPLEEATKLIKRQNCSKSCSHHGKVFISS